MHTWHWISSAISLVCIILFTITGITLNHANYFEASANEIIIEETIPQELLKKLKNNPSSTLTELRSWIKTESKLPTDILQGDIETTNNEIYIQKPIPGGDKWLSVDLDKGTLLYSPLVSG